MTERDTGYEEACREQDRQPAALTRFPALGLRVPVHEGTARRASRAYAAWARVAIARQQPERHAQHAESARFWRTVAAVKSRAART